MVDVKTPIVRRSRLPLLLAWLPVLLLVELIAWSYIEPWSTWNGRVSLETNRADVWLSYRFDIGRSSEPRVALPGLRVGHYRSTGGFDFRLSLLWPLALASAVASYSSTRRRLDVPANRCPACAYDLRATLDRCPECGRPAPADAAVANVP